MSLLADAELLTQKAEHRATNGPSPASPGRKVLAMTGPDYGPSQADTAQPAPHHHDLPPPLPGEDPSVASARQLLQQTETEPATQLLAIRRVLEQAELAPPSVAIQLLHLLVSFGADYPALANVIAARIARLETAPKPVAGSPTATIPTDDHAQAQITVAAAKPDPTAGAGPVITPANRKQDAQSMAKYDPGLPARQLARQQAEWEEDKKHPNFRDQQTFAIQPLELFHAISVIDMSVPLVFRRMMLGQVLAEQSGGKPNRNFGGVEFTQRPTDGVTLFTRLSRSDWITDVEYHKDPDKYYDNHAYGYSIKDQLENPSHRYRHDATRLMVNWFGPRAAYDGWGPAANYFHNLIMTRHYHKLLSSPYPEHQDLANRAWAGKPDAYLDMLELNSAFDIYAADPIHSKPRPHDVAIGKYAYNGTGGYQAQALPSVTAALHNETLLP